MLETIQGNLYDYPKYYDLVYGSDWKAEFDYLEDCFEKRPDEQSGKRTCLTTFSRVVEYGA